MKFKVKEKNDKYFNEVVSTMMMENRLKYKPNSKIINIGLFLKACLIMVLLFIIFGIILLIKDFDVLTLILIIILVLTELSFFGKFSNFKERILLAQTIDFSESVTIDKNGITEDKGKYGKITLKWNDIDEIYINKYSIVLIGKENSEIPYLSYPIEVKEDFIKGLKAENKEKMIKYTKF